jgi:hexosaminidase
MILTQYFLHPSQVLWSPRSATDLSDAAIDATVAPRLSDFRCLLLERGVAAAPTSNLHARQAPKQPGSCLKQRR